MTTCRANLMGVAGAVAMPRLALSQQWPSAPIRSIVPFPAGGPTDAAARAIAAALELPWSSQNWINEVQSHVNALAAFFNRRHSVAPEVSRAAWDAARGIRRLLDPIMEERPVGSGSDLISRLWRNGDGSNH